MICLAELSISEIKNRLASGTLSEPEFVNLAAQDGRAGIQKLLEQIKNKETERLKEYARLVEMCRYETAFWQDNQLVAGVDEAGRGPLAGPVAVAAVVFNKGTIIPGLNDSKKLSEQRREALEPLIKERALAWSVEFVGVEEIDSINILQATYRGFERCLANLTTQFNHVLIDGNQVPALPYPVTTIVKGDSASVSIAAASILAKVARDRLMLELDKKYPQYGFGQHKGYGTGQHIEAIRAYGLSPEHRRSFCVSVME